jgi:hypothetical protein
MERFFKIVRLGIFFLSIYFFMSANWMYDYLETLMDSNAATLWGNLYTMILLLGVITSFTFLFWSKRK